MIPPMEILKKYLIYFYLCYLKCEQMNRNIIIKLEKYFLENYINEYETNEVFNKILKVYILKNNNTYIYNNKHVFIINDNTLISSTEKNFFTLKEYTYSKNIYNNYLCTSSMFDFYLIQTLSCNLLFHEQYNTIESINASIELLQINMLYISLNFKLTKNDTFITGINKSNYNFSVIYNINSNNIIYNEYKDRFKVIKDYTILPYDIYKQFYKLMSNNDIGLFLYASDNNVEDKLLEQIFYLRTINYDFVFKMTNNEIYYEINNIWYIVKFNNDKDTFNNYGILKLSNNTDEKIICIYNYKNITKNIPTNDIKFINKKFLSSRKDIFTTELIDKYKLYYFTIINKYNDKYIITNILEVLSLLINCLKYNSPYLILSNVETIKNILNNNMDDNLNKLLNTLFLNFDNIYSLYILLLFYDNKYLNKYYYEKANELYLNYNILLKLEYNSVSGVFTYDTITYKYNIENIIIRHVYNQQFI